MTAESHHAHAGHHHHVPADASRARLALALGLIVAFMLAEVVVGLVVGSLALLSDAAHMLTDAAALALALVTMRLAQRPAAGRMTFGYRRAEILSAQANGATLLVLGGVIVAEGIRRLVGPVEVDGWPVVVVALAGVGVNLAATRAVGGAGRESLNVEGAYQHLLTDLFAFLLTAVAGTVILLTGFDRADGIASLVIAAIMLRAAYGLLRDSGRVLLEAAPAGLEPEAIGRTLAGHPEVVEVHDLHVWEVGSGFGSLSAHVTVEREADCHAVRRDLEACLHERFGLDHTTLQVDHRGGALLHIAVP